MATLTSLSVRQAADILGIAETASITEIRSRYRALAKEWHPDVSENDPDNTHVFFFKQKTAYEILIRYCLQYPIPFCPEDLVQAPDSEPMDRWMERYGDDPIWGPCRSPPNRSA